MIYKKLLNNIENRGATKITAEGIIHSNTLNRQAPNSHPQEAITGLTSDLNAISERINNNEESINKNIEDISKNSGEINLNTTSINTLTDNNNLLQNKVESINEDLVEAKDAIEVNKTDLDNLKPIVQEHEERISTLEEGYIYLGEYDVVWNSKTSAISAGTNLKDLLGGELWTDICTLTNRNKYKIEVITGSKSNGTDYNLMIEGINGIGEEAQKVVFNINTYQELYRFDNPSVSIKVSLNLMVNNQGETRFYVKWGTALNANFKIRKIKLFKLGG